MSRSWNVVSVTQMHLGSREDQAKQMLSQVQEYSDMTPEAASYIAANEMRVFSDQILAVAIVIVSVTAVTLMITLIRHHLRQKPGCGVHEFTSRHDKWLDGDVWRHTYVRDVCSLCGVTVERADMLPEAKETDQ